MEHPHETGKKASDAKSVSKTLAILSTFDERTPMQRTSDIAARLGMNISTVSRHLNTLLDWGFLRRDDGMLLSWNTDHIPCRCSSAG